MSVLPVGVSLFAQEYPGFFLIDASVYTPKIDSKQRNRESFISCTFSHVIIVSFQHLEGA